MKSKTSSIISWICQIAAIAIMGQTLFFKFSGAEESVMLFTQLGMEPQGRIIIGICELVACLLLIYGPSAHWGALLGAGVMGGAIIGHFTTLGWEGANGELGMLAVITFVACLVVLFLRRNALPFINVVTQDSDKTG